MKMTVKKPRDDYILEKNHRIELHPADPVGMTNR